MISGFHKHESRASICSTKNNIENKITTIKKIINIKCKLNINITQKKFLIIKKVN